MIKRILLAFSFLISGLMLFAQGEKPVEMADTMRSNGKIYVVAAVILTIFTGIIIYLVRLDRKISRLEKEIHS
jgi:CcmD family protein